MRNSLTPMWSGTSDLMASMNRAFDDVFNLTFGDSTLFDGLGKTSYPRIDVYEDEKELVVEATVPGLTKDDVKVEYDVDSEVLEVKIERAAKNERNNENYKWKELHRSKSVRHLYVPKSKYNVESIKADVKDGLLTVKMPVLQIEGKPVVKKIEVR